MTIAASLLLGSLTSSAIPVALPRIVEAFNAPPALVSWAMTAYLLSSTVAAPIFGKLGDVLGRKKLLLWSIGIFVLGSVGAGLAPDLISLIAARVVQGLGGGGLMVVSMALIADVTAPRERAKVHGWLSWVFAAATIAGPLVGGVIVELVGWRWVFLMNAPLGFALFFAGNGLLRDDCPVMTRAYWRDYAGTVLLVCFLSALVMLTSSGGVEIPAGLVAILACLACMSLAFFIWVESRSASAILPWALFRIGNFSAANGLLFFVGVVMFVEITFLPIYLQMVKRMAPTESAVYLLPLLLAVLVSSTISGAIASRTGRSRVLLGAGMLLLAIGMAGLSMLDVDSSAPEIAFWMVWVGLGLGPASSLAVPVIQNAVPAEHLGAATAAAGMFRNVGGLLGVAAFGLVFTLLLSSELGYVINSQVSLEALQLRLSTATEDQMRVILVYQSATQTVFFLAGIVSLAGLAMVVFLRDMAPTAATQPAVAGAS